MTIHVVTVFGGTGFSVGVSSSTFANGNFAFALHRCTWNEVKDYSASTQCSEAA